MKTYVIVLLTICLAIDGAAQHSFDIKHRMTNTFLLVQLIMKETQYL